MCACDILINEIIYLSNIKYNVEITVTNHKRGKENDNQKNKGIIRRGKYPGR